MADPRDLAWLDILRQHPRLSDTAPFVLRLNGCAHSFPEFPRHARLATYVVVGAEPWPRCVGN